ncbi:nucleotidyltransferase [Archangium violaceum]|uniref:nucleotidyltransferase domain-containing protein n=1 Tax=Archangium violaceum TaxID=83451 RepID=UPI00194E7048|nr:nucleotidyltransferase [Archangium violaceum]QRN96602.1 nucleotidyltransferase [Archangium violaceum]
MWSVREALEKFIQSLELTQGQRDEVSRQHTLVRESLRQRLDTKTDFLAGSYSRNTAIRPLHDIDLFVVLGDAVLTSSASSSPGGSLTPDAGLKQVRQALHAEWRQKESPTLQQHSVHIGFSKSGVEFDVVPAFEVPNRNAYLIPERHTGQWILTNPRIHQTLSTEANEAAGKKLKPLLKAVKHWNRNHSSSPLRSFHLEVMSYSAFPSPPGDYLEGLEILFSHLSQKVLGTCPDPARLGPDVDARMKPLQKTSAQQVLASAAREVRLAREESDSNPPSAHGRLKKLFGEFYRDRGP